MREYYVYGYFDLNTGIMIYLGSGERRDMLRHTEELGHRNGRQDLINLRDTFDAWLYSQDMSRWDDYRKIIAGPFRTRREAQKAKLNMMRSIPTEIWVDSAVLGKITSTTVFCSDGRRWDSYDEAGYDLSICSIRYYLAIEGSVPQGRFRGLEFKSPPQWMLDNICEENNCIHSEVPEDVFRPREFIQADVINESKSSDPARWGMWDPNVLRGGF